MTTNPTVDELCTSDLIDRRTAIAHLLALTLLTPPAVGVLGGCGGNRGHGGMGDGEGMPGWMMSGDGMMDGQMMADMPAIHDLLVRHDAIRRQVEDLPDGIRARTTSDDPSVAQLIQTHVQQMTRRIEAGPPAGAASELAFVESRLSGYVNAGRWPWRWCSWLRGSCRGTAARRP